jgi:hypothetical protein
MADMNRKKSRSETGLAMYMVGHCSQKKYGCKCFVTAGLMEDCITNLCLKDATSITWRVIVTGDCCHLKDQSTCQLAGIFHKDIIEQALIAMEISQTPLPVILCE